MGSLISCNRNSYSVSGSKNDLSVGAQDSKKMNTADMDYVESILCKEQDISNEGMKEFEVEGSKVLVVKTQGKLSAIGGKCSHYGLSLSKGVLYNGKIRCPFHGACFDLNTGDIEDFPGLDSLPIFDINVEANGEVKLRTKKSMLSSFKRVKGMAKKDPDVKDTYVVLGGGAAGAKCVETLRQEGFTGRVVLVCAEENLPYDRPKLSKMMHQPAVQLALRTHEFYEEADIEIKLGCPVVDLDASNKVVKLTSGESIPFQKCLIATGGRARKLSIPGSDLKCVYVLRTPTNANAIAEAALDKAVVIVGTSFIGMEAAAYFATQDRAASVTVIGNSRHPFERTLGLIVGARLQALFEEKGVKFINNASIIEIQGHDDSVAKVLLSNGSEVSADLVLAGIGVVPSTDFLKNSAIELDKRGYVPVNKLMETNINDIYSAGDIASFPFHFLDDALVSIGHWQMSLKHGHVAALNMLGRETPIISVPFFWTMFFGKSLRYAGHGPYDDVVIGGDLDELCFIAYYCKEDRVVSVATLGKDPAAARFANYLQSGNVLKKERVLRDSDVALKLPC